MMWRPKYYWEWGKNPPDGVQLRVYVSWRICGCGVGIVANTEGWLEITLALGCIYAYLDIPAKWCAEADLE